MRARGARPSAARRPGGAALLLAALVAAAAAGAAHAARVKQAFPVTGDGVCRMGPPCAFKCSSGCINATLVDYQARAAARRRAARMMQGRVAAARPRQSLRRAAALHDTARPAPAPLPRSP